MSGRGGFWLLRAPGPVERVEARFAGAAYAPHRHDTYAIGITLEGVQRFDYRGATRNSLPGGIVVLHPDELHDGRAGDERAFRYRSLYLAPADMQKRLAPLLDKRAPTGARAAAQAALRDRSPRCRSRS